MTDDLRRFIDRLLILAVLLGGAGLALLAHPPMPTVTYPHAQL